MSEALQIAETHLKHVFFNVASLRLNESLPLEEESPHWTKDVFRSQSLLAGVLYLRTYKL